MAAEFDDFKKIAVQLKRLHSSYRHFYVDRGSAEAPSKRKEFDLTSIQVVACRDDLEFSGMHPFCQDWFRVLQLFGNVDCLSAHGIFDRIAWLAFSLFDCGLDGL